MRLAVIDDSIAVDGDSSAPGRGAWVHAAPDCLERIERERGRLKHALRTEAWLGAPLVPAVRRVLLDRTSAGLTRAAAAGALVSGARRLGEALSADAIVAVAIASDASERTVTGLSTYPTLAWVRIGLDRKALGALIHRGPRAAVGATRSTATQQLVSQLHMLRSLG